MGVMAFLYRLGVRNLFAFSVIFVISWFFMLDSGIHSTVLGVIVGLLAPATPDYSNDSFANKIKNLKERFFDALKNEDHHEKTAALRAMSNLSFQSMSMLERLEIFFHPWNIFYVLPLFALFNAGFEPSANIAESGLSIAIAVSLVVGKLIGVTLFSYLGLWLGIANFPKDVGFADILGVGFLAGIGFTMSIFISTLAFADEILIAEAKSGIFIASLLSGLVGYLILRYGRGSVDR